MFSFEGSHLIKENLSKDITKGERVYIDSSARVFGDIILEDDSSIWCNAVLRGDIGTIHIGKRSNIQDGSVLHLTYDMPLFVGESVAVGHNCNLHSCTIGNNVLVGIGSILLDGSVIGDNCIIGAGSLIPPNKIIPPNSLVMGQPGKVVKSLSKEDEQFIKTFSDRYVEYKDIFLSL